MQVVAQDAAQVQIARDAYLQHGKGRHPAGRNFGDCATFALAKGRGFPLLFKGTTSAGLI
jgi:ribonuclease VapC